MKHRYIVHKNGRIRLALHIPQNLNIIMPGRLHQVNTPHILRSNGALVDMVTPRGNHLNSGVTHLQPAIHPNSLHNSGVRLGLELGLELEGTSRKVPANNGATYQDRAHQYKVVGVARPGMPSKRRRSGSSSSPQGKRMGVGIIWQGEELTDEVTD